MGSTVRFKWKGGVERHTRREYISSVGIFLESEGGGGVLEGFVPCKYTFCILKRFEN